MAIEMTVPSISWMARKKPEGQDDYDWVQENSAELFNNKRVVVFALPGAFTPTCSSTHLPGYEANYEKILEQDVDEVYCLSVNDSFVMNAWMKSMSVEKVKPLADGSGKFTRQMGMLVDKDNLGFGYRSWRYSMVVNDGIVERIWIEPGQSDNFQADPYDVSDYETMLNWLEGRTA
jgi:peroxiredoxin